MKRVAILVAVGLTICAVLWSCQSGGDSPTGPPEDRTPPAAVQNLAAAVAGPDSVVLTWTAPGDDGTSGAAAQYDLRYSLTGGDPKWEDATPVTGEPVPQPAGSSERFVVRQLAAGTTHHFLLRCADEVPNWSTVSNTASVTTTALPDSILPAGVTDLTAGTVTTTSITLRWTAPGDDGMQGTVAGYDIRRALQAIDAGSWAAATPVASPSTPVAAGQEESVTLAGLIPGTTYHFALEAFDESGNRSPLSNAASASTPPAGDTTPPAAIEDLAVTAVTTASVTLTWTAPGDDGATGTATAYDLRYSTGTITDASWAAASQASSEPAPAISGTEQSFAVTGLPAGTAFTFAIRASDEAGNLSPLSNVVSATTATESDAVPPSAVADLTAAAEGEGSLRISWTAPGDDAAQGTAFQYDLRYSTATIDAVSWAAATQAGGEPSPQPAGASESVLLDNLSPGTTYHAALRTADEAGNWSALSNIASAATAAAADSVPPGAIDDLLVLSVTQTSMTVGWTAPGDDAFEGTAAQYDLRYSTSEITDANWNSAAQVTGEPAPETAGSQQSFTIEGLQAGGTYFIAVKTIDEAGNGSALSNVLAAGTEPPADQTAPGGVVDLHIVSATTTSLTVGWSAPGDDGYGGTATQYDLRWLTYEITPATWVWATQVTSEPPPTASGTLQTYTLAGLLPGQTVYIALKTADEVPNWSALSNVVHGATQTSDTTPPVAVTDLAVNGYTMESVTLTWTAPGDDNDLGTASQYEVRYATQPFSQVTWDTALPAAGEPAPQPAGSQETFTVGGLQPNTIYYFGLKTADEVPNWSAMSNSVSRTTAPTPDVTPPAAISNLAASDPTTNSVMLTWTATGDDGTSGDASHYDIRYANVPIQEANWSVANQVTPAPEPRPAGYPESFRVTGLESGTTYYFAMKAGDEAPNWSTISNSPSASTYVPIVDGYVKDPEGHPIPSALVRLFTCGGTHAGASVYTTENGYFVFQDAPAGDYYLDAIRAGCTDAREPADSTCFTVTPGQTVHRNDFTMECQFSTWASVTLTWAENPRDLDLHLWTPEISGSTHHVYYANQGSQDSAPFAELDHDDVTSYGPENLTIYSNYPGEYIFAVYHFSGSGTIATSQAQARIVLPDGSMVELDVPDAQAQSNWWWHLVKINGTTGEATVLNEVLPGPPVQTPMPRQVPKPYAR